MCVCVCVYVYIYMQQYQCIKYYDMVDYNFSFT